MSRSAKPAHGTLAIMYNEHVAHLAKRHHTVSQKLEKLRGKVGSLAEKGIRTIEIAAGAVIGGVIQGRAGGTAHLLGIPVDLVAGVGLHLAGYLDLAGDDWSDHLNNVGDGFLGAFFSDVGHGVGKRWKASGSLVASLKPPAAAAQLAAPTPTVAQVAAGDVSPQQMADMLIRRMG